MFTQGVICVNKPAGMTSHDVVGIVRRRLGIKRVGHTGTLDPMATGVLPVAFGKATRMIEYYAHDLKSYHATMQLGIVTDTLDTTGEVLETHNYSGVTEEDIRKAFGRMQGNVTQIPPKYSALKVNGRRLYDYARKGQEVEIKPRQIYIAGIHDIDIDLEQGIVSFDVDCAKGTYVRTICDDIGRELGTGAAMTALERTASGVFNIGNSVTVDMLKEMTDEELAECIIPVEETLTSLGTIEITDPVITERFMNGQEIGVDGYNIIVNTKLPEWAPSDDVMSRVYKVFSAGGEFLGTGSINADSILHADKVIYER